MITFRCRCSHLFSVADDRAGESLQCPSCGLLVDVPSLDDAGSLEDDGSYTLRESIPRVVEALPDVTRTPSVVNRADTDDRRLPLAEFLKVGTSDDDLLEIKDEVRAGVPRHPKYDPVTGELIVPLDVKRDPIVAEPLVAQPVVLGYQRVERGERPLTIWMPFVAMLELPNLIVNAIVVAAAYVALFMMGASLIWLIFSLPVLMMLVAHFANVVDETGPTRNDELPRPMRSANLYEDVLRPLVQVAAAYAFANVPILLVNLYVRRLPPMADLGMSLLFFSIVPALLLTMITSGAANNLVPHRALSPVIVGGLDYWVTTVVGFVATGAMLLALLFAGSSGYHLIQILSKAVPGGTLFNLPRGVEMGLAPLVMFGAVYLMHCFAWQLGVLYRRHHERFAWVLQKHDKGVRNDTLAQLHRHRQRLLEEKAKQARDNLERRQHARPGENASRR